MAQPAVESDFPFDTRYQLQHPLNYGEKARFDDIKAGPKCNIERNHDEIKINFESGPDHYDDYATKYYLYIPKIDTRIVAEDVKEKEVKLYKDDTYRQKVENAIKKYNSYFAELKKKQNYEPTREQIEIINKNHFKRIRKIKSENEVVAASKNDKIFWIILKRNTGKGQPWVVYEEQDGGLSSAYSSKNICINNFILPNGLSWNDIRNNLGLKQSDKIYATPVNDVISVDTNTYKKYQNKLKSHTIFYTKQ